MADVSRALVTAAEDTNYLLTVKNEESGSGAGFKRFSLGLSDINKSARPIKDRERKQCNDRGINLVEIVVAHSQDQSETLRLFVGSESLRHESVCNFLGYCLSDNAQVVVESHGKRLSAEELKTSRETLRIAIAAARRTLEASEPSDAPKDRASRSENGESTAGPQ
ncbi:hypothetical protein FYK55_27565 [Roseiconus nitratireducens]|uniref:Uncharacterized protein n=1 Tax=Roseiconus nitratireducens TaxID=2605748 RepID=A0A5M6CTD3_9BACT|nr:hypothetical protein [Roseiconus nitratireducens]KAA5538501.1 hypothetical protein FYK55_27565 [Roseiconus nitratireducens]